MIYNDAMELCATSRGWDKVTLSSKEIKSLTLAVLELCLSEGISK